MLNADRKWGLLAGAGITLLGGFLAIMPGDSAVEVRTTAWVLLVVAALELLLGAKSSHPPLKKIEIILSCVTLGAALLILLRPVTLPLTFLAIICLAGRGVGASVASFEDNGSVRYWVFGRGMVDLSLAIVLIIGAPLALAISVLSGAVWTDGLVWPGRGGVILINFVALSVLANGISLIGLALRKDPGASTRD